MTRNGHHLRIIALFGCAIVLAGCAMKPLYSTSTDGQSVENALAEVEIPAADDRLIQIIRNDLLSAMRPAGTGGTTRYTLQLESDSRIAQAAELNSLGADRRTVIVNVSYRLVAKESGKVVDSGRTFSQVSYDETGQSFADLRARDNAYERAAHEVSLDIRSRLAAHFATS
jgi:LPS-assembly lipoprotein